MRMQQEFTVTEPVSAVWKFFEEPETVAGCLPGVEQVTVWTKTTSRSGPPRAWGR